MSVQMWVPTSEFDSDPSFYFSFAGNESEVFVTDDETDEVVMLIGGQPGIDEGDGYPWGLEHSIRRGRMDSDIWGPWGDGPGF